VNKKMPIGAKGRILKLQDVNFIKIVMREDDDSVSSSPSSSSDDSGQVSLTFTNLDELKDYNRPQAVACLMKAVFLFTRLIDFNDVSSLDQQLLRKLNGSFELHTWTGLPQGSGLGTSSILIGCVLKVVWHLMGIDVSAETLSYSILIVEQIMTTSR
jgi:fucokinase